MGQNFDAFKTNADSFCLQKCFHCTNSVQKRDNFGDQDTADPQNNHLNSLYITTEVLSQVAFKNAPIILS